MRNIFVLFVVVALSCACNSKSPRNKDLDKIKKIEAQIFSPRTVKIDTKLSNELTLAYEDFYQKYPQDTLSPKFLFKLGEVSMSTNQGGKAIQYFEKFQAVYPNNNKAPQCLFLQAFIYETQIKDLNKAKQKYEKFINKYPKHELVKDAIASIGMLGKSPEEIIKGFEEKNKQATK